MTNKLIGTLGILTTTIFALGFIGLFIIHPQTFLEINNIGLTFFNLDGMEGETWIKISYIIVGLLNIFFAIGLFKISDNKSALVIGKIFLLLTGLIWVTFGLINYRTDTDFESHLMATRAIATLITSMLSLLLLGGELEKVIKDKFLKYYTISSGVLIMLISILSLSVFMLDESWIRSNISWTIYFLWFGVFGIRLLQKASGQQKL